MRIRRKWLSVAGLCALFGAVGLVGCDYFQKKEEKPATLRTAYDIYAEYLVKQGEAPLTYGEWIIALAEANNGGEGETIIVGVSRSYWTDEGELVLVLTDDTKLNVGKFQPPEHVHAYGEWQDLTANCQVRWQTRTCIGCGNIELQEAVPVAHDFKDDACRYCDVSATKVFNGDYGYTYLGTMQNGEALQAFYTQIDEAAVKFHADENANAVNGEVATITPALTLSADEMIAVWKTYMDDNPLYYWLSNTANHSVSDFTLLCDEGYALGSVRAEQNERLYSGVEEYLDLVKDENSKYKIALAFHDAIIKNIDYARDANLEPSNERWAHTVIGVFEGKGGVCESYARAFQLLLNAKEIENVLVTGSSSEERHAWNMVQLEDGEWYYCDLTWDDTSSGMGVRHNYFCVAETQDVVWSDGFSDSSEEGYFATEHFADSPKTLGVDFLYGLPKAAETPFAVDGVTLLRQQFTVDGYSYSVSGFNSVQFIDANGDVDVEIPESVTYNGTKYLVTSIGSTWEDGKYANVGSVVEDAKTVYIPQTVYYIWSKGIRSRCLENITVDKDNPYFTSLDGVLFTKSLYTLILYPIANPRTEYRIPDQTAVIAHLAFENNWAQQKYNSKLIKLTFGKGIKTVGRDDWGDGQLDSEPTDGFGGNIINGAIDGIVESMAKGGRIFVDADNKYYMADEEGVYAKNKKALYCLYDKRITTYEVPATMTYIDRRVFYYMTNLRTFTVEEGNEWFSALDGILYEGYAPTNYLAIAEIPKGISGVVRIQEGVKSIPMDAFRGCRGIKEVVLPSSVKSIEIHAFASSGLERITLPDSVESIGYAAFSNCESLESVTLGKGVTKIEEQAFAFCNALKTIFIGDNVMTIEKDAFRHCENLTIYCEAVEKPDGWDNNWNALMMDGAQIPVVWGYQPE